MPRRLLVPLLVVVLVAVGGLAGVVAAGWSPQLGLDLQGGFSVVLAPENKAATSVLDQSIEIIRNRVDALGVAEPEINRQGDQIIVQLPGVADRERAREIVGTTAELRFRPVLEAVPPEGETASTTTSTTAATTTTSTAEAAGSTTTTTAAPGEVPTTPRDQDVPEKEVVLPTRVTNDTGPNPPRYRLGPAALRGEAVDTARANFQQNEWVVTVDFTGKGNTDFNKIAATCFNRQPECPTGQLAIVLDGVIQSAPVIREPEFQGSAVISGSFTQGEAKDLALVLRYGALPVQLEVLTEQSVSATLGRDALDAGVASGIVGLALVSLFMIAYYRMLGVVASLSLSLVGALTWITISWLGETQGLALTLAGVSGIVVSIGIVVDSNVVYYERLKEEVHGGRTVRSSVDHGFGRAFSTILRADTASLIGAALLYLFTVGPVRGFAFMLGLTTFLDILVSWFFMRPAVIWLGRSQRFSSPRLLGLVLPEAAT